MKTRSVVAAACIVCGLSLWYGLREPVSRPIQGDPVGSEAPSPLIPQRDRSAIEQPPDSESEDALRLSLSAIDAAARATRSLSAAVRDSAAGGSAPSDPEWLRIPRSQPFVRMFLEMPPGLPIGYLHRAPDLNPEDEYIPKDVRDAIEVVLVQYRETLDTIAARRDAARRAESVAAIRAGAKATPISGTASQDPISIPLVPEDAGAAIVIRRDGDELRSTRIDASHLARFQYLNALYWFVARELGCHIVGVYSVLGYLPVDEATAMTRAICDVCGQRSKG